MKSSSGYYQRPTIHGEQVVFVCENDLWLASTTGGPASRLTANPGRQSDPHFSPDGRWLAFTSRDEGPPEIYVLDTETFESRRLTFLGGDNRCAGWSRDGQHILFATNSGAPFGRVFQMAQVPLEGGLAEVLPWGPASHLSYAAKKGVVLGRHTWDPARWKRYRGGTAGQIWIDRKEKGEFQVLVELEGNLTRPLWVGKRIFFGSDHQGICNLYSCKPDGGDLRQHSHHEQFYLRYPNTDGRRIVYQAGGDLYVYDPARKKPQQLEFDFRSPRPERARKFVSSWTYFEGYDLAPDGDKLAVTVRGRPFTFSNWENAVTQLGERDGVRYRLARWCDDGILCVSDRSGEEQLELFDPDKPMEEPKVICSDTDLGRAIALEVSPNGKRALIANHRHELLCCDLEEETIHLVERNPYSRIGGASWSPDSAWLAYSFNTSHQDSEIRVYNLETGDIQAVTTPSFYDYAPDWDPEGRYLYFVSCRDFEPVRDNLFFELSFPKGARPFLVTLKEDTPDPFLPLPRAPGEDPKKPKADEDKPSESDGDEQEEAEDDAEGEDETESNGEEEQKDEKCKDKKPEPVEIDFEGITGRVRAFPVPEGRYGRIHGIAGKVLFMSYPVESALNKEESRNRPSAKGTIHSFEWKSLEKTDIIQSVTSFRVSSNRKTLAYRTGNRLRLVGAGKKPDGSSTTPSRKTGYVDLSRVRVSLIPEYEWRQMFREAWRLMRDHFWDEEMSQVDWEGVYHQYEPLLDRIATRHELSDLLWEFQGELGTSHAYEYGGDYSSGPYYSQGKLGADFAWDEEAEGYRITHIVRGDSWNDEQTSPLLRLACKVSEGDLLLAVDGVPLGPQRPPQRCLVHRAKTEVNLTMLRQGEEEPIQLTVKALRYETPARYREWVERNRAYVHEKSKGRLGYVHIPNMGVDGFAEFHRGFYSEVERDGLVIDVRYNGGGNVSQLLLEKLARRRLGYDVQRWGLPIAYPQESPFGPLVAITNEQAGSDGDIFSHCFKLMDLGPLIGKRTWGGVIGIWPRHALVDGTITTQPEFAFWFQDVGWSIENYGTDPDEEVEIAPQDWRDGRDPQLDRAIELGRKALRRKRYRKPKFEDRPSRRR